MKHPNPDTATGSRPGWLDRLPLPPALALLTLLLLAPFLLAHHFGRYDTETDFFGEYAPYARLLQHGTIPETFAYRGPGYHLALAATGFLARDLFTAGKVLSALSCALLVAITGHMAARLVGRRGGLMAGLFCLVQPAVLLYGWTVGNDMFFSAVAVASLALVLEMLLRAEREPAPVSLPAGLPLVAGFLAGYAQLTRPNGIFLPIATLLALAFLWPRAGRGRAVRAALLYLAGWGAPLAGWSLAYLAAHGHLPRSANFRNLMEGVYVQEITTSSDVYRQTIENQVQGLGDVLRLHGGKLLQAALAHVPEYLWRNAQQVHGFVVATLALAGALVALTRREARGARLLLPLAGGLAFGVLLFTIYAPRLSILLAMPVALGATFLFVRPGDGGWRVLPGLPAQRRGPIALVAVAAALAFTLAGSLGVTHGWLGQEAVPAGDFAAGAFIRGQAQAPGCVAARKPHVAYAAGREYRGIPMGDLAVLADSLRARGVAFLHYGPVEMEFLPQYGDLLLPEGIPTGLQLVWLDTHVPVRMIFRVLPTGESAPAVPPGLVEPLRALREAAERSGTLAHVGDRQATDAFLRGKLLLGQGKPAEALPNLRTANRLKPGSAEGLYLLGCAAAQAGAAEEAVTALTQVEAIGATGDALDFFMGQALLGLGRLGDAESRLRRYLEHFPTDAAGMFLMATLRERQGQPTDAASWLKQARAGHFPNVAAMDALEEQLRRPRAQDAPR